MAAAKQLPLNELLFGPNLEGMAEAATPLAELISILCRDGLARSLWGRAALRGSLAQPLSKDHPPAKPFSDIAPLQYESLFMQAPSKPASPSLNEDKQPPVATFKNSLRAWQIRYKARLATQTAVTAQAHKQDAPA